MRILEYLIALTKNLFINQEAIIWTEYGEILWFQDSEGMRLRFNQYTMKY